MNKQKKSATPLDNYLIPILSRNSSITCVEQKEPLRIEISMIGRNHKPHEESINVEYKLNKDVHLFNLISSIFR